MTSQNSGHDNDDRGVQKNLEWSIIVIARNEETTIGACLQSVVDTFRQRSYELIFVDSASTDQTVRIAQGFPARVICLPDTAPLRPSVGRHIGLRFARGKWILFLDGDSTLNPEWVTTAADALRSDHWLGGIAGESEQVLRTAGGDTQKGLYPFPENDYDGAEYLGQSAAYRRDALERVGGFNPFMYAAEEEELGARLRKAGYRLLRLRNTMTREFIRHPGETTRELFRRIKRGFFVGLGQILRHAYAHELPVREGFILVRRHLQFFVLLVIGIVAVAVSVIYGRWEFFLSWISAMVLVYVLFVIRSRGFRKPTYYFLEWALTSPIIVWGILKAPRTEAEFPDILTRTDAGVIAKDARE